MLLNLEFKVKFAVSGRVIEGNHQFQPGMTAIFGANESGKSLRLEMIGFAWWGAKYLRTPKDSFETLTVKSTLKMGDHIYRVERNLNGAKLFKDEKLMSNGTTPVNAAIEKMFGYDMQVFRIANACMQNELSRMTAMLPSERKAMLDKTIGLDAVDTLLKEATKSLAALYAAQANYERLVVPLTEPKRPKDYNMDGWKDMIANLQDLAKEKVQIESTLKAMACPAPTCPLPWLGQPIEELYRLKTEQDSIDTDILALEEELNHMQAMVIASDVLAMISAYDDLKAYLVTDGPEQWEAWRQYERGLDQNPPTLGTEDEYEAIMKLSEWRQTEDKIQKLLAASTISCPHCKEPFSLQQAQIDGLRATQEDVTEYRRLLESRNISLTDLHLIDRAPTLLAQARKHRLFIENNPKVEKPSTPDLGTRTRLQKTVDLLTMYKQQDARRSEITFKMAALRELKTGDYSGQIAAFKKQEREMTEYNVNLERWTAYQKVLIESEPRLKELEKVASALLEVETLLARDLVYDMEYGKYTSLKDSQDKIAAELAEIDAQATELEAVKKSLNELKPKVKTYLIPSLAKVASGLINEMTGGEHKLIEIDDNINIKVDGDLVEALSGSGQAVTHLSTRIALGSVLTNKVFSVLMVDEADASMDEKRSKYTADAIRNLGKIFGQIIMVSHKKPDADHYIEL